MKLKTFDGLIYKSASQAQDFNKAVVGNPDSNFRKRLKLPLLLSTHPNESLQGINLLLAWARKNTNNKQP